MRFSASQKGNPYIRVTPLPSHRHRQLWARSFQATPHAFSSSSKHKRYACSPVLAKNRGRTWTPMYTLPALRPGTTSWPEAEVMIPLCACKHAEAELMMPLCVCKHAQAELMMPLCVCKHAQACRDSHAGLMIPLCVDGHAAARHEGDTAAPLHPPHVRMMQG